MSWWILYINAQKISLIFWSVYCLCYQKIKKTQFLWRDKSSCIEIFYLYKPTTFIEYYSMLIKVVTRLPKRLKSTFYFWNFFIISKYSFGSISIKKPFIYLLRVRNVLKIEKNSAIRNWLIMFNKIVPLQQKKRGWTPQKIINLQMSLFSSFRTLYVEWNT